MPRGDGTGPMGMGPMTGRGAGYCAGYPISGFMNPVGCGLGFGRGRGFRRSFYATGLPYWARFSPANVNNVNTDQNEYLKKYAEHLERQLSEVKKLLEKSDDNKE